MKSSKLKSESEQTEKVLQVELVRLRQEIAKLQQRVTELENEKVDLELQLELQTDHSDYVANDLFNQVEETLRESAKRFRQIADATPVPVVISRVSDGLIVYVNRLAGPLVDLSTEELLGRDTLEFYDDSTHRQRLLDIISQQGSVNNYELQLKKKDGTCFWVAASIQPLTFDNEFCLLSALYDLTERKQVEEERSRLSAMQQELALAHQIQESLLPASQPNWSDLDVVCYSAPARDVGGDFYTYYAFTTSPIVPRSSATQASPSRFGVAVGDISGKGMPAALLMAVSFASLQAIIDRASSPSELLGYLDQAIAPYTQKIRQNCALCYVDITPPNLSLMGGAKGRIMRVANAGCIEPIIRRTNGQVQWVEAGGMPLGTGFDQDLNYMETTFTLITGDMVILSSDGVIEAMNMAGEIFGFDRFEQAVATGPTHSAKAMLAHLRAEVTAFTNQVEAHDDMTIVVLRV